MNYYKVIVNGAVIDVNYVFLKWQEKNKILIGCAAEDGQFIQSSDQKTVWRAPWLNKYPEEAGGYEIVKAVEISEEEYKELRAVLDLGEPVQPPAEPELPPEEKPEEPEPIEPVMSPVEMRLKINELEEKVKQLDILEGCVLELSEIVYA